MPRPNPDLVCLLTTAWEASMKSQHGSWCHLSGLPKPQRWLYFSQMLYWPLLLPVSVECGRQVAAAVPRSVGAKSTTPSNCSHILQNTGTQTSQPRDTHKVKNPSPWVLISTPVYPRAWVVCNCTTVVSSLVVGFLDVVCYGEMWDVGKESFSSCRPTECYAPAFNNKCSMLMCK